LIFESNKGSWWVRLTLRPRKVEAGPPGQNISDRHADGMKKILNIAFILRLVRRFRLALSILEDSRRIGRLKPKAIQKILQRKGVGTRLTYTAEDLIQTAKQSVATISPAKELILQGKVRTLQHLRERYDELTKILTEYCKASMLEDFEIITQSKELISVRRPPFLPR
jgi:DNA repair protein RadC